jgi:hypothetical protein
LLAANPDIDQADRAVGIQPVLRIAVQVHHPDCGIPTIQGVPIPPPAIRVVLLMTPAGQAAVPLVAAAAVVVGEEIKGQL